MTEWEHMCICELGMSQNANMHVSLGGSKMFLTILATSRFKVMLLSCMLVIMSEL